MLYCPVCGKAYDNLGWLKRHFRMEHVGQYNEYICYCCDRRFKTLGSLVLHAYNCAHTENLQGRCHLMFWILARSNHDNTTFELLKKYPFVLDYLSRGITFKYLREAARRAGVKVVTRWRFYPKNWKARKRIKLVSVKIPEEWDEALELLAKIKGVTKSELIRQAIVKYILSEPSRS